ncbi:MAG: DUF308 domain-containing protein [Bacteroidales bacterium]|jgi:uncharacterized membrane protein HdeD (DUF308 family)|nr:DUF308 domain-containing protein [Bacteroidales bacterium]
MENLIHSVKQAVKYWWVSLLVGILALILGIWSIATPDVTLVALTYVFIFAFFISGILEIVFAISNREIHSGWGWTLASGIIDLLFGILLLALPLPLITTILIYFVGFWILFRSIWAIGDSVQLQRFGVKGWGWLLAFAILSIIFSFFFLISPMFGGVFIVAFVSVAFISYGIFRIYLSIKLRSLHKDVEKITHHK